MTNKSPKGLGSRYLKGLRAYLEGGVRSIDAAKIGREALAAGGDTLGLARIHDSSLRILAREGRRKKNVGSKERRAEVYFAAALAPIERGHRASRELFLRTQAKAAILAHHAAELFASNRLLKKEVMRRKRAEEAEATGKLKFFRLFTQSQEMQRRLRHLTRKVISAQEEERREISHELHDEVVQTLVGINAQLAALGQTSSTSLRALKTKIAHAQRLLQKSVSAVHEFARELRPAALDDLGLIPALQGFIQKLSARKRIKIHLNAFAGVEKLDSKKRLALYRVAQESLTNVGRHANATLAKVHIFPVLGAIRMEIHDNGKSFAANEIFSSKTNKRIGLLGMRERVEMVGGSLVVVSTVGIGTTIRAEIPVAKAKR